jgi:transposase
LHRRVRRHPALRLRRRRQFSEEFKEGAVRLVLDEGKTVGAVARELDLTASALSLWVRQARAERTKGKSGVKTVVQRRKSYRVGTGGPYR